MCRRTVRGDTRIPSFTSSSDAIRSWPHPRFAINCRRSAGNRGRPRGLDFNRQNSRNPFRCHRMSVSGFTTVRSRRQSISRDSAASVTRIASSGPSRLHMPLDVQRQLLAQKEIFGGEVRTRAQHRRYELHDVASDARDRAYVEARSGPGHASGWYATDARGDLPLRGHGIRLGAASSGPNSGQILPGWNFRGPQA